MRLAFVDFSGWDFTPDTPYQRPLGGSHSAMCYLAEELARQGHQVWMMNGVATPVVVRGVSVVRIDAAGLAAAAGVDAVIVLNGCPFEPAAMLRRALGDGPLFIYWTQHAEDQPASANLADPAMRALWDAFVLISDWQAERYRAVFDLPAERTTVLRNAVGPSFRDLFPCRGPVFAGRPWPPVLAYTSTPFRGLSVLMDAFPLIRREIPGTTLKVFSSMAVYQVPSERDSFADLYRRCRETEGVEYVGSLPQPELARELRRATCLSYPNTFAETSCIAVMEALAAGCLVTTSTLGALRETLGGYGFPMQPPQDPAAYAEAFARLTVQALRLVHDDPERAENYLADQVEQVNAALSWPVRARQWGAWLAERAAERWAQAHGLGGGDVLKRRVKGRAPLGGGLALSSGRRGIYVSGSVDDDGRAVQTGGEPDEPMIRLLLSLLRPSDAVVEIGAGAGLATVALAQGVGPGGLVAAIESRPGPFALLCANLALNGLTQARPLPGLSAAGWAALAAELPACRLLTINVAGEGETAAALDAAAPLFDRFRPLIYCRIVDRSGFDALKAAATRLEYRLYRHGWREGPRAVTAVLALPRRSLMNADGPPVDSYAELEQSMTVVSTG